MIESVFPEKHADTQAEQIWRKRNVVFDPGCRENETALYALYEWSAQNRVHQFWLGWDQDEPSRYLRRQSMEKPGVWAGQTFDHTPEQEVTLETTAVRQCFAPPHNSSSCFLLSEVIWTAPTIGLFGRASKIFRQVFGTDFGLRSLLLCSGFHASSRYQRTKRTISIFGAKKSKQQIQRCKTYFMILPCFPEIKSNRLGWQSTCRGDNLDFDEESRQRIVQSCGQ